MNLFKKKLELTEEEKSFENVVLKLLLAEKTIKQLKLLTTSTTCLLINNEKHFKVKVDEVGILIQNSTFSTKERLREKFTQHLKNLIIDKINEETDETLSEMDNKEKKLIENINNILE